MPSILNIVGSHRFSVSTDAVTLIAADADLLAVRSDTAGLAYRLRSFEAQFITTTAFTAAQRVGFQLYLASTFSAAHTGGGAITFTGGKSRQSFATSILEGRISATAALTPDGSTVLDANPIAEASAWAGAVGAVGGSWFYDLTQNETGGYVLAADQGFVVENAVAMGAAGVGLWHFTFEGDVVVVSV